MSTDELSDFERASVLYQAVAAGGPDEFMVMVVIPGAPPSKARHRHGNGRTFKLKSDVDAEIYTGSVLRAAVREPFAGNVALGCIFYRPNRQRIDTDNMLKHVCDAANGVLWVDDSQVTAVMGITELDADNPRTIVVVGRHESTMTRGSDNVYPCTQCGAPIERTGQTKYRKTCSKACSAAAKGYTPLDEPVPCTFCGEPFKRTTNAQAMCSPECRKASRRGKLRSSGRPLSECIDCGTTLTHRRGGRCRPCWIASQSNTEATS